MKLRNVAKGTRAIKEVRFRLANAPVLPAPAAPGQALPDDEYTVTLGVRVLTGTEVADVYQQAQEAARARGVSEWLDTHPLCRLYEMAYTLAVACVDIEARDEPFFASADEVMSSPAVGGDNIAYLFEQHGAWQDECSIRTKDLTVEQVIGIIAAEAERPENAECPLDRMRPSTRRSFLRITAHLLTTSLAGNLLSTSTSDFDTQKSKSSSGNEPSNSDPTTDS